MADLDDDGDYDVIVPELFFGEDPGEPTWGEERHNLYVFEQISSSPVQWQRHNIAPNSFPSHQPQLVDVNRDGLLDIISQGAGFGVVSYYENRSPKPGQAPE